MRSVCLTFPEVTLFELPVHCFKFSVEQIVLWHSTPRSVHIVRLPPLRVLQQLVRLHYLLELLFRPRI